MGVAVIGQVEPDEVDARGTACESAAAAAEALRDVVHHRKPQLFAEAVAVHLCVCGGACAVSACVRCVREKKGAAP